jgi:L-iditol 2-dehydrogenase
MKAALLKGIENLVVENIEKPLPGEKQLLIKVKACAVCGTDIKVFHYGHKHISFPRITGHELSGIIEETGSEIKNFHKGDRVTIAPAVPCGKCYYCLKGYQTMCDNLKAIGYHYNGGFAEYMLVPENAVDFGCVNKFPDNITFEQAALAEPLACVINGQELSRLQTGDTVLIIGAGPIGCLHAEMAKISGAGKVIIADISAERIKMAEFTGAILIDTGKKDLKAAVEKLTAGRMADRVIVAAGSDKAQETAVEMVAKRGSVNFFGGLPKNKPFIKFNSNLVHYGEFFVVGTHGSTPLHNRIALDMISTGKIKIKNFITHRFGLEQIKKALETAESKTGLKIVVFPQKEDA